MITYHYQKRSMRKPSHNRWRMTETGSNDGLPLQFVKQLVMYLPFRYLFNTFLSIPHRLQKRKKLWPSSKRSVLFIQESAQRFRYNAALPTSQFTRDTGPLRCILRKDPSSRASNSSFCFVVKDSLLLPLIMVCLLVSGSTLLFRLPPRLRFRFLGRPTLGLGSRKYLLNARLLLTSYCSCFPADAAAIGSNCARKK